MISSWQKVAEILAGGGVAIIPSDASYGLAASAKNKKAVEKLYQIKGREKNKPSLIIVSSIIQAKKLVKFTPLAKELTKKYWPGGLTLVLEAKKKSFPSIIYGSGKTLAVRLPKHPKLQKLAQEVGPFILPSANLAGKEAPYKRADIDPTLVAKVDFTLNEKNGGNLVSTLVDARGETAVVLRPGAVTLEF